MPIKKLFHLILFPTFIIYAIRFSIGAPQFTIVQEVCSTQNFQKTSSLSDLIFNIKQYKLSKASGHAGDLYEHSVWTSQVIKEWFKKNDSWTVGLNNHKDKYLAILAGILHDIGKAGDLQYFYLTKLNHAKTGFEYLTNKKNYYIDQNKVFDFNKLFKNLQISDDDKKLIAVIVRSHHFFWANVFSKISNNTNKNQKTKLYKQYLSKIKKISDKAKYAINERSLKFIMLISAADSKATGPVITSSPLISINKTNISRNNPPAIRTANKSNCYARENYETKGKKTRKEILEYFKQHYKSVE